MKQNVPILITWDVDPDHFLAFEQRQPSVDIAMDVCQELGIQSTFFITAETEHVSRQQLERMLSSGHELGCHGLTHRKEENYDRMPQDMQRTYIEQATEMLRSWSGQPMLSFRSPRVKTSAETLKLLSEHGYLADSSVCSQRIDFVSSNFINRGWLFAPRRPYRPHIDNAFKRGKVPIWEVPVSAVFMPFISTTMSVFGLTFMKVLFRLLYAESRRNGKPIVYLAHPVEFVTKKRRRFELLHLTPSYIRAHGLLFRKWFYRMDGEAYLKGTKELFAYMTTYPDVDFMTVNQYVTGFLDPNLEKKNSDATKSAGGNDV